MTREFIMSEDGFSENDVGHRTVQKSAHYRGIESEAVASSDDDSYGD